MDKDELPGVRLCVLKDNDGNSTLKFLLETLNVY